MSAPNSERTDWFITPSGRRAFVLDPDPSVISIEDIAHTLSHVCRFGGMCRRFYSVAQHSVFVSTLVPDELALVGLLHDATEAYLGDVIRPLKRQLPDYRDLEVLWWIAIARAFGVNPALLEDAEVKRADMVALMTERRDFAVREPGERWDWVEDSEGIRPHPMPLRAYLPNDARLQFLRRWGELRRTA